MAIVVGVNELSDSGCDPISDQMYMQNYCNQLEDIIQICMLSKSVYFVYALLILWPIAVLQS